MAPCGWSNGKASNNQEEIQKIKKKSKVICRERFKWHNVGGQVVRGGEGAMRVALAID